MSNLIFTVKMSDISKEVEEKIEQLKKDVNGSLRLLAKSAKEHADKLAKDSLPPKLSSIYSNSLYIENIADNITVVGIREEAFWIENGRKEGFMEELLTRKSGSEVKTSKEGHKYRVIPFEHSTSEPKNALPEKTDIANELRGFLKSKGVPYSKSRALALDDKGSPRIGKIHSFDIKSMREGKKGKKLSENLQGVTVFQDMNPKTGKVERSFMTFRVISEKHRGTGKWEHPGRLGEDILQKTFKWLQDEWQQKFLPELKRKYESK